MNALLDAIRAEIEPLEARLDVLREMQGLALRLVGEGEGDAGPSDPPARQTRREAGVSPTPARSASPMGEVPGGSKTRAVLKVLRERGDWMRSSEIADALGNGSGPDAVKFHTLKLTKAGLIEARGATSSRRYRATGAHAPKPKPAEPSPDQTPAALDAEIAARNGGIAGRRIPRLKQRVAQAVVADPGALTEPRLAMALGADREDVALACGELLGDGEIHMRPDGTYTTQMGGSHDGRAA